MRTCDVAGAADSRYRLSCADVLSDAHRDRACEAVGISCLDSAAVVYNDVVTVAGIASAHALDCTVEWCDCDRSGRTAAGKSKVDAGVEVAVTAQGSPAVRRADARTRGCRPYKAASGNLDIISAIDAGRLRADKLLFVHGLFSPDA